MCLYLTGVCVCVCVCVICLEDAIGRSLQRELATLQEYEEGAATAAKDGSRDDIATKTREALLSKKPWSPRLVPEVGMHLVWLAVNSLNVTDDIRLLSDKAALQPEPRDAKLPSQGVGVSTMAFRHVLRPFKRIKKIGVIGALCCCVRLSTSHPHNFTHALVWCPLSEWSPLVYESMKAEPGAVVVEPWALPMLVPPKPWKRFNSGGYLLRSSSCVRLKVSEEEEGSVSEWDINNNCRVKCLVTWSCCANAIARVD
jgi:hypothetical protein